MQLGMANAVLTTCGQAYGAKEYEALGVICQRGLVLQLGAAVLLTVLYIFSGDFLRALGQADDIAAEGQIFCRTLILQLFALAVCFPLQRFLQGQNITSPIAYFSIAALLIQILISWLAAYVFDYGLIGIGIALGISFCILDVALALYVLLSPECKKTWTGFSSSCFKGLWPYLKFAVASGVMLWYQDNS